MSGPRATLPVRPVRHTLTVVFGRLLECRVCLQQVDLIELPEPWIPDDQYVCGTCLEPVEKAA